MKRHFCVGDDTARRCSFDRTVVTNRKIPFPPWQTKRTSRISYPITRPIIKADTITVYSLPFHSMSNCSHFQGEPTTTTPKNNQCHSETIILRNHDGAMHTLTPMVSSNIPISPFVTVPFGSTNGGHDIVIDPTTAAHFDACLVPRLPDYFNCGWYE